jgi:L-fucose mutarotase
VCKNEGEDALLKNIDPLLNAEVLGALRAMGHGDRVVLCDTNFPADSVARQTVLGRLLRIDAASCPRVARAILSVIPLDSFVEDAAARMEVVGKPAEIPPVQKEVQQEIDRAEGKSWPLVPIERMAFYEHAKRLLRDRQRRAALHGCFIFAKGVIPPDDK